MRIRINKHLPFETLHWTCDNYGLGPAFVTCLACWTIALGVERVQCLLVPFCAPSDGVFGRFDLAALLRLPHLKSFVVVVVVVVIKNKIIASKRTALAF